jgi:DNA helicase-2/ATP-dependent DNA helicase PcrA
METKLKLNSEQQKAITFGNGPLLIIAGAGTGKTMVITQRIAHLILDKDIKTDAILALTFTEKAAEEMEERVDKLLPYGYVDLWISTFHSFCQKVLEQNAIDIGLPNNFKLLDETAQWLLVRNNLNKFNLDYYKPLGNPTKFIQALIKHFSRAKDEEVYPEQYLEYAEKLKQNADSTMSDSLLSEESLRIKEIADAYHVYQQLLLDNNSLDFGDLINYTLKLFRTRPKILDQYQRQFEYILLDEFQDTNYAQYDLIKLLAGQKKNLTVVGDDDQSIYKFRGASVSNILQFKEDFPESQEIVLTTNYRSKQNILDLAYNFIQLNNPNRLEYQLNNGQKSENMKFESKINKRLKSNEKGQGIIEHIHQKSLDQEVAEITQKIIELKQNDKEASWSDFAILVRANESANPFISYLRQTDLPYQFLALRGLYNKPVILDILAYFKLLDNYHESPAVWRILNSPILEISQQDIIKITHQADKKAKSIYEVLQEVSAVKGLASETISEVNFLLGLINKHSQLVKEKTVSEIFKAFLEDSKYLEKLIKKDEYKSNRAVSYINQFYKKIKGFEESAIDSKLKIFMEEIELELEAGEKGALALDLEAGPEMIKIMTIHAAKGLEFKYVFIPNLVDRRFPTNERKDPIELPDELIKEILPEGNIHLQEERRLFYVAMTRAKQGLFFSSASDYGGSRKKKLSRFLQELVETNDNFKLDDKADKLDSQDIKNVKVKTKKEKKEYELPQKFSYSQLVAFNKCPYQYKLAFIMRVPIFGKAVFSYGKSLHKTLEEFFKLVINRNISQQTDLFNNYKNKQTQQKIGELVKFNELIDIFENFWIDEWYESKEQKENYYKQAKNSLKFFYEQIKNQLPQTDSVEKPFNLKIGNYTIKGVIDRIDILEDGSINVIDYKTGKSKEQDKLNAEDKMQLLIYQIAAEEIFNKKVNKLIYYYLDDNSIVEFIGREKDKQKIKEQIIKEIEQINSSNFVATPGWGCQFCDFNEICEFKI